MAVSVKAYLNFEHPNQEIRRFSISEDVSSSFEYLTQKIRHVYPSLLRKDFTLYWRDEDQEFVAFSSDEELVIALGSSREDGSFKVFIEEKVKGDSTDGLTGDAKTKHPGVICDVCDKEIVGTRFKCLSCPDYDLCSGCEGKGFHPEHEMLRIRTPQRHPWQGFWHMMFAPRGGHPRGRGCHSRGRPDPRPYCHPPPHHFGPRGSGGCRRGFGGPFGPPFGTFPECPKKAKGEQKASEASQQEPADNGQNQGYPSFQEVFDDVSQVVRQFMDPENYATWDREQPPCDPEKSAEKETAEGKEQPGESDEEKKDADDTPMQTESFVVLNKESDAEKEADKQKSEENVSQRRAEVEEFERRLNEAISQMETMGFNNENGWLGQLLIAKDFDIGRVIDTLQSKQN
ncbi:sequestosome-1-like isoform X2 [Rhopilema esculentum]|uniref:sequestosome-1-like isoform X2 n=1 Tax=Rhopilema esculentum TaxID=499914 RepID=UPI0031DE9B23